MGGYYASIAKSLERIADALEKMTAPSGQDRELLEKIESETLYKHQAPAENTGAAAIESVRLWSISYPSVTAKTL